MPIKIKSIAKPEPGVAGGGNKKYYAQTVIDGTIELEDLCKEIEKISTVSEADVMATLMALVAIVPDKLADSKIVRIGALGSFRPSVSSIGHTEEKEVSAHSIKKNKVLFHPGERISQAMKITKYKKVS